VNTHHQMFRPVDEWFDTALALIALVACEVEVLRALAGKGDSTELLTLYSLQIAAFTVPLVWRRRAPLLVTCLMMTAIVLLVVTLPDLGNLTSPALVALIPAYSVAAYAERLRASIGLAVCLVGFATPNIFHASGIDSWVFSIGVCVAAWVSGMLLRSGRVLTEDIRRRTVSMAAERDSRERLAVADERSRIARELQALVARGVGDMVVQSELAGRLLTIDPQRAGEVMTVIEDTGRETLSDMRRILGILRHPDEAPQLAPQPGLGQIPFLVEQTRTLCRDILLQVEGEPGPLPSSIDFGLYRILADTISLALQRQGSSVALDIVVRFHSTDIELEVSVEGRTSLDWPSVPIAERVVRCGGCTEVRSGDEVGQTLLVRMPRTFDEVLA
jgi:signal transduction histidine kinase